MKNTWCYAEESHDDMQLSSSINLVVLFSVLLLVLLTWSYFAKVAEVSTGEGRIVANSREQVIQSLEGGILKELYVSEGDVIEKGQLLAQLDRTKAESNTAETAARYRAMLARVARLTAEVDLVPLVFPESLESYSDLVETESRLYTTRTGSLHESLRSIELSQEFVAKELELTESLVEIGAASNVEVLRLQRQLSELELQSHEVRSEYMVLAREELTKAQAEVQALGSVVRGRTDSLDRLSLVSPVRGVVKDITVSTQGGVVPPNGQLMAIMPLDDTLLVETRISPRDIAFIYPGQEAKIKISAYDYTVYGGMEGKVKTISPDTIQDETRPDEFYYRIFVETEVGALVNKEGESYPIVPGMVASVDVRTGEKTIFDYLMKPISQTKQALRER